jgi:hypothetical protein
MTCSIRSWPSGDDRNEVAVGKLRAPGMRFWLRLVVTVMALHIAVNLIVIAVIRNRGGHALDWVTADFGIRLYIFAVVFPIVLHSILFVVGLTIVTVITRKRQSAAQRP